MAGAPRVAGQIATRDRDEGIVPDGVANGCSGNNDDDRTVLYLARFVTDENS